MAWKKHPERRRSRRRYKRWSSEMVKPKEKGPSKMAIFSGGRTIPPTSDAVFDYRKRAIDESIINDREWLERLFNLDARTQISYVEMWRLRHGPEVPRDWTDTQNKMRGIELINQVRYLWGGNFRHQRLSTWNSIFVRGDKTTPQWTKMFFEGHHYVLIDKGTDGLIRRSIVYHRREDVMQDLHYDRIVWSEFFEVATEPALQVPPST